MYQISDTDLDTIVRLIEAIDYDRHDSLQVYNLKRRAKIAAGKLKKRKKQRQ